MKFTTTVNSFNGKSSSPSPLEMPNEAVKEHYPMFLQFPNLESVTFTYKDGSEYVITKLKD